MTLALERDPASIQHDLAIALLHQVLRVGVSGIELGSLVTHHLLAVDVVHDPIVPVDLDLGGDPLVSVEGLARGVVQ